MYLDHVTDSVLKGIGEHVFSMWVNISDSLLSVILVWFLIPRMGIMGYALVIVVMEGYNFLLSFLRLRGKINFCLTPIKTVMAPLFSAGIGVYASKIIFRFGGSATPPLWLVLKMLFGICVSAFVLSMLNLVVKKRKKIKA